MSQTQIKHTKKTVERKLGRLKRLFINADQNQNDATLQLFDGVKRHLERILGPYAGGYLP